VSALADVEILAPADEEVLTREALGLVARLHRELNPRRRELLERRQERQLELDAGELPGFLSQTKDVRDGGWRVAEAPADLRDRRCEITGPVDRKMMINALNSGARVFMADYEDACSPRWENVVEGQRNVTDAVHRRISLETPDKTYRLNQEIATLLIRPRGWHLPERHATRASNSAAAAARTSTSRSSSRTSRRGCGRTRSCWPRSSSGSRPARSAALS
jgi:malate synthase